jgi:putative flippase GtrA
VEENKELEKAVKNTRGDVITNDRKTYYETQQSDSLTFWYRTLMTTYYLFLFVFFLGTLFSPNNLSLLQKILIIILLFIYPFIISPIANYVVGGLNKMVTYLFPKNVYKHL